MQNVQLKADERQVPPPEVCQQQANEQQLAFGCWKQTLRDGRSLSLSHTPFETLKIMSPLWCSPPPIYLYVSSYNFNFDPSYLCTAQILLIQESCRLAVEICDDLLNYEKFDDNDMPLVIKTAPAVLLFHEIVQPFNVQVM